MPERNAQDRSAAWFSGRQASWQAVADQLPALEDARPVSAETVLSIMRVYPELARDLAVARRLAPGGKVTRFLQQLYTRVHRALFRAPQSFRRDVSQLVMRDAPVVFASLWDRIAAVTLGFVLAACAGWWLVDTYPELAGLFASEDMIDNVQGGELWTDGLLNIMPSSLLAAQIFTNNIVVSLTAVCLGVLYGLGTVYIISLNGLMLGGVFAFTAQHDLAGRLFEFVCAHGFVELSVICIAGAIGFSIGEAIARPGHRTRVASLQRAAARGGRLLLVCLVFLVGAGLIEGYLSPDPRFSLPVRLAVGLGYWVLFMLTLAAPLARTTRTKGLEENDFPIWRRNFVRLQGAAKGA